MASASWRILLINTRSRRTRRKNKLAARPAARLRRLVAHAQEFIDLSVSLILPDAVALLNFTLELLALAIDGLQVIIGQLAPMLLNISTKLLPISLDTIPIHGSLRG